jgi:hypothetical protein
LVGLLGSEPRRHEQVVAESVEVLGDTWVQLGLGDKLVGYSLRPPTRAPGDVQLRRRYSAWWVQSSLVKGRVTRCGGRALHRTAE